MTRFLIVISALLVWATAVFAQNSGEVAGARRVSLSAQAQVSVAQDLTTVQLSTTREGLEAQTVQNQLKQAVEAALALTRADAAPGLMDVRSGRFGVLPRYARDGKISGWQGTAELLLEGTDLARITASAARVQTLNVGRISFGLSLAQRQQAQAQAQQQAIALFRQRATDIARAFDAAGYTIDDVQVQYDDVAAQPRMEVMAVRAMAADGTAVPAEAGQTLVRVSVTGAVKLK